MMRFGNMTNGFSLNELLVVMAIIGLLIGIGVPASKMLTESFASSEGTVMIVGAALSNARAIAASEGTYAGVRFQQDATGNQYLIFIIHDPTLGDVDSFRAIEGRKPVRLPVNAGVMDMMTGTNVDTQEELRDETTFSIVFSAVGKLAVRDVKAAAGSSSDDVFNTPANVDVGVGMFYQDNGDVPDSDDVPGLAQEPSRRSFVVYNKKVLAGLNAGSRYISYLKNLEDNETVYVNPYTGDLIK